MSIKNRPEDETVRAEKKKAHVKTTGCGHANANAHKNNASSDSLLTRAASGDPE